ncbi:MAG: biopolymer transporter ExbD [Acidobacteria bacterium]|nr:biopolymer transporter ExbD [Acidobacteriota bacterium]
MGMAVGGAGGGPMNSINMTPLIDVLLVLLIIFMVITPLTPKGLEALVPLPNPDQQAEPPSNSRTIVVSINADKSILINRDPTGKDILGDRLQDIFKTRAERVLFVRGAPSLDFFEIAEVIDIAKGAGVDKVGLLTEDLESGF